MVKQIALIDEFNEWDLRHTDGTDIKTIIHNYRIGNYDGDGDAFCRVKGNRWFVHPCGHCSCYGPLDDISASAKLNYSEDEIYKISENYGDLGKRVRKYIDKKRKEREDQEYVIYTDLDRNNWE